MTETEPKLFRSIAEEIESNPELVLEVIDSVLDDLEAYFRQEAVEPPVAFDIRMACEYAMQFAYLAPGRPVPPIKLSKQIRRIDGPQGTDFSKIRPAVQALRAWCREPIRRYFEARALRKSRTALPMSDADIPF